MKMHTNKRTTGRSNTGPQTTKLPKHDATAPRGDKAATNKKS